MGNIQYIGARYVPKFYENSSDPNSIEWESGKAYEPLTIVSYNDDTYTSKITVPSEIGNPADNPHYWAKTAAFNAALEALQQEVGAIKNNIGEKTILTENESINEALYKSDVRGQNSPGYSYEIANSRAKVTYFNFLTNTTTGQFIQVQGAAYDTTRNLICLCLRHTDTDGWLVEFSPDDPDTIVNSVHYTDGTLIHTGPMTYDSKRDIFITFENHNEYRIFSAANLTYMGSHIIDFTMDTNNEGHGVAYDADRDLYYTDSYIGMYSVDPTTFRVVEYRYFSESMIEVSKSIAPYIGSNAPNGFTYKDGYFYINLMRQASNSRIFHLLKLNYNLDYVATYDLSDVSMNFEFEDLTFINGFLHGFGSGMAYADVIIYESPYTAIHSGKINKNNGITLPSNSDLDKILMNGKYFIPVDDAPTINSMPFQTGGDSTLYCIPLGGRIVQIVIGGYNRSPAVVYRTYTPATDEWTAWISPYRQNLVRNMTVSYAEVFYGYVTPDGNANLALPTVRFVDNTTTNNATATFNGTARFNDGSTQEITTSANVAIYNLGYGSKYKITLPTNVASLANTPVTFEGTLAITIN